MPSPCPKHHQVCDCGGPLALHRPAMVCMRCRRRYPLGVVRTCNCISRAETARASGAGELLIFFATGRTRAARRKSRLLSGLIRWLSWSDLAHVAVGYGGAVLDPAIGGNRFYELDRFLAHYPTLACVFRVPVLAPVDLDRFQAGVGKPKPVWPTLRRWLTGGAGWTGDCVCTALSALAWGRPAAEMPLSIATPKHLHSWLESKGYAHLPLDTPERRASARQLVAG